MIYTFFWASKKNLYLPSKKFNWSRAAGQWICQAMVTPSHLGCITELILLQIEEIVSHYGIVVITRGGSNPQQFIYESDVLTRNQNNIHIVTEWIYQDISSTKIR